MIGPEQKQEMKRKVREAEMAAATAFKELILRATEYTGSVKAATIFCLHVLHRMAAMIFDALGEVAAQRMNDTEKGGAE